MGWLGARLKLDVTLSEASDVRLYGMTYFCSTKKAFGYQHHTALDCIGRLLQKAKKAAQ